MFSIRDPIAGTGKWAEKNCCCSESGACATIAAFLELSLLASNAKASEIDVNRDALSMLDVRLCDPFAQK